MSVFTRSRAGKVLGGIAVAAVSAVLLAGCAGGGSSTPSESSGPAEDLTLKIGSVLPQTGSLAFLGPPEEAGVLLAVDEVNKAAKGITVDFTPGDSGDADNKAFETTVPKLQSAGVSAMIGAAASGVTKLFLDSNVAAGIITFSPANTSPDFTNWDDKGLYWRTAPSDLLQGEVLGNLIAEDGHKNIGIIYQNDAYGTGLFGVVKDVFESTGGKVVAEASYNDGDSSFDAQVATIAAAKPDAVVLVTFDQFATIAPLLVNAGLPASNFYLVDGNLKQWGDKVSVSLEGAKGTTPGPVLEDDFKERLNTTWTAAGNAALEDYSYAAESYDAVVLLALSALAAKSTTGADMAGKLQEVSGGSGDGKKCTSFSECADIILGGGVADYDGYSGPITFDEHGDPTQASIGIFQFGADNMHTRIDTR
ncbi:ABC transporter substrate-binding protein [Microbacterium hominis]|uniref:Amino acid ABC transporter substrate-binding protein n=1 Tax=Microbacterium hominis TaxID=162426 RepID=A0A134DFT2_9MICO|nr:MULTISPECIES: ABC transporter substrate-binding protein [Microbacterium]AUG30609.1 amino acid ABC transporter substrate-binding protein [Microbacterium hominis]KXC05379.1 amino acid ABC transporter substrate-binding protein [Microbacterium hominis]QOC26365.1 ABC transporter substrate-binding protein [Microbacterium hominis]QRY41879.1 ABC transporter substrate-binding protein [Microbacterium hominis]QYF97330.1 ABC transporter substrate-binding protein [Microbacterium sp. PAMC21962]